MHQKSMIQSLALAGCMTALNAIFIFFSSLSSAFFFTDLFLVLFLPLITVVVSFFSKKSMLVCYFFASVLICTFIQWEKTLFYLIPSLLSGFLFAFLLEKGVHALWIIVIATLLNILISTGLFWISSWYFQISMSDALQTLFHLSEQQAKEIFPLFICITSMIQSILCSLIIFSEAKKFQVYVKMDDHPCFYLLLSAILFSFLSGVLLYWFPFISSTFLGLSLFTFLPSFYYFIHEKKYFLLGISCLLCLFGFALFSTFLPGYGLLPLSYWVLFHAIMGLILYRKKHRNDFFRS